MPRGLSTILSPSAFSKLCGEDPHNWRIQKHMAAIKAIELFHLDFDPSPKLRPSPRAVPYRLMVLCDHYNNNFLIRPTDSKLSPLQLWRVIYRRMLLNNSNIPTTSHKALFSSNGVPHLMKLQQRQSADASQRASSRLDRTTTQSKTTLQ